MPYCAYCGSWVSGEVSAVPCASCGKPTNGAPAPGVVAGSGNKTASIIIGVLLGGLALVFLLGIIAAIAIPNFLTAMNRSKQKRTMADIRALATAIESYAADNNQFPDGNDIEQVAAELVRRKYASGIMTYDGWKHQMRYEPLERGYAIISAGKDGVFQSEHVEGGTANFDCDIVFANGRFVQYPEGSQGGGR